jgi:hypothetical protein
MNPLNPAQMGFCCEPKNTSSSLQLRTMPSSNVFLTNNKSPFPGSEPSGHKAHGERVGKLDGLPEGFAEGFAEGRLEGEMEGAVEVLVILNTGCSVGLGAVVLGAVEVGVGAGPGLELLEPPLEPPLELPLELPLEPPLELLLELLLGFLDGDAVVGAMVVGAEELVSLDVLLVALLYMLSTHTRVTLVTLVPFKPPPCLIT